MLQQNINQVLEGIEQGIVSAQEMEQLTKALTAGAGYAGKPSDLTGGGVLQTESLDSTLMSVTYEMSHLKFWPSLHINKANSLYEQYNRLISHGSDLAPYMGEGGAAQEDDSSWIRDGKRIAFFGTRRKVSHQMTLVRTIIGDVVAQYTKEATTSLLGKIERELYWGLAHFCDASGAQNGNLGDFPVNSIDMAGLLQQLLFGDSDLQMKSGDFEGYGENSSIVVDLAGAALTQDDFETIANIVVENFGVPSQVHLEPKVLSTFVKQFYPQFRSAPGLSNQTVGYDVNKVITTAGTLDLKPNLFLRARAVARDVGAPKSPTLGSATISGVAANSNSGLVAGDYIYKATFVNDFGESSPIVSAAVTVAANQKVTFTFANIPNDAKYIKVYRTAANGAAATAKFIGNYKVGLSAYVDNGAKLPGRGEGFILDLRPQVMEFKQLAPLTKINLAIVQAAVEFMLVIYGSLFVYAPRFNGVFRNVGA